MSLSSSVLTKELTPPSSLMLSQLLKLNGASKVVIAANKGIKMDIAKDLEAGDEYIELDR
jgi:D-arabinitol dehydrogenase (NADP+)